MTKNSKIAIKKTLSSIVGEELRVGRGSVRMRKIEGSI